MTIVIGILSAVMVIAGVGKQGSAPVQDQAEQLVRQLREFRAAIPGMAPSNGALDPLEERRGDVYRRLRELGDAALPALIRGLADRDVELRRNVALFLDAAAGSWFDRSRPRMNILGALPALVTSLDDRDDRVRELAAQAIGEIGPNAVAAVPALVTLLSNSSEGSRNTACIGLARIGPAAKTALPALRNALSDPSATVRRFAQRAIEKIDVP